MNRGGWGIVLFALVCLGCAPLRFVPSYPAIYDVTALQIGDDGVLSIERELTYSPALASIVGVKEATVLTGRVSAISDSSAPQAAMQSLPDGSLQIRLSYQISVPVQLDGDARKLEFPWLPLLAFEPLLGLDYARDVVVISRLEVQVPGVPAKWPPVGRWDLRSSQIRRYVVLIPPDGMVIEQHAELRCGDIRPPTQVIAPKVTLAYRPGNAYGLSLWAGLVWLLGLTIVLFRLAVPVETPPRPGNLTAVGLGGLVVGFVMIGLGSVMLGVDAFLDSALAFHPVWGIVLSTLGIFAWRPVLPYLLLGGGGFVLLWSGHLLVGRSWARIVGIALAGLMGLYVLVSSIRLLTLPEYVTQQRIIILAISSLLLLVAAWAGRQLIAGRTLREVEE